MRLGCYHLHHHYLCIAVGRREHSNFHHLDVEALVTSYVVAVVFVVGDHCCVDSYDNFAVAGGSNNHLTRARRYPSFDADNHYYSH